MIHEFHLSARGKGGVFCDKGGAFVGAVPLLVRTRGKGKDEWRPRDCDELSREMSAPYGLPVDMSSKRGSLTVIAKALNDGHVARAQVAALLLGVPDPPYLSKGAPSRQETIKLACALRRSGFLKADWDPDEHPRWPTGAPDSQGGQFAPKGNDAAAGQSTGSPSSNQSTPPSNNRGDDSRRNVPGAEDLGIDASMAIISAARDCLTPRSLWMDWGSQKPIRQTGKM